MTARVGGPNGEILVDRAHNAACEACRVLMSRGIVGLFETRKPGIDYPCMTGDIEKVAGLTALLANLPGVWLAAPGEKADVMLVLPEHVTPTDADAGLTPREFGGP